MPALAPARPGARRRSRRSRIFPWVAACPAKSAKTASVATAATAWRGAADERAPLAYRLLDEAIRHGRGGQRHGEANHCEHTVVDAESLLVECREDRPVIEVDAVRDPSGRAQRSHTEDAAHRSGNDRRADQGRTSNGERAETAAIDEGVGQLPRCDGNDHGYRAAEPDRLPRDDRALADRRGPTGERDGEKAPDQQLGRARSGGEVDGIGSRRDERQGNREREKADKGLRQATS